MTHSSNWLSTTTVPRPTTHASSEPVSSPVRYLRARRDDLLHAHSWPQDVLVASIAYLHSPITPVSLLPHSPSVLNFCLETATISRLTDGAYIGSLPLYHISTMMFYGVNNIA